MLREHEHFNLYSFLDNMANHIRWGRSCDVTESSRTITHRRMQWVSLCFVFNIWSVAVGVCENTYRYRSGPQEIKVCVFPEQVTLRVSGVKLLSPHDEMAGEVTPCTKRDSLWKLKLRTHDFTRRNKTGKTENGIFGTKHQTAVKYSSDTFFLKQIKNDYNFLLFFYILSLSITFKYIIWSL